MKIDNLDKVLWRFEAFVGDLRMNREDRVLKICGELSRNDEFKNVCHRAKQEVQHLTIDEKKDVIELYYIGFKTYYNHLEDWKKNKLKKLYKFNQVNIALNHISNVFGIIKYYYNKYYLENDKTKQNK